MARLGHHALWPRRVDSARLDVAHPARLSQHVFETWHSRHAGRRGRVDQSDPANARPYKIHRRERTCLRRAGVSLCLHHHRLRRGFWFSLAHCFGHDAEDDQARVAHSQHRLRRDGSGNDGRINGDDRGVRVGTRRIFRDQYKRNAYGSCRKGFRGRLPSDRKRNADPRHEPR